MSNQQRREQAGLCSLHMGVEVEKAWKNVLAGVYLRVTALEWKVML